MSASTQPIFPHRVIRAIFLWPIILLWRMVTMIGNALGILLTLLLGLAFMAAGYVLTATVIGAVIGIPLFVLGFLLLLRALW